MCRNIRLHFYILSALRMIVYLLKDHSLQQGVDDVAGIHFKFIQPCEGLNLAIVYLVWISVVIA